MKPPTTQTIAETPAAARYRAAHVRGLKINAVKAEVATYYRMDVLDLMRKERTEPLATRRQLAMVLARELACASSTEVAAAFNRGDHCTVLHAEKAIADKSMTDPYLVADKKRLTGYCRDAIAAIK